MNGAKIMNRGLSALMLFAGLAAAGCGTTTAYRPLPEDTRDLTPAQARRLLMKAALSVSGCHDPIPPGDVTYEKFHYCGGPYRYAEYPTLISLSYVGDPVEGSAANRTCINPRDPKTVQGRWPSKCLFFSLSGDASAARDFVRAWIVLARDGAAFKLAQDSAFELATKAYREAAVKPELPEDAVRLKVQAEGAVREKRFGDAADLYDEALGVAPWWPAGHYNRGLILGELKSYEEAIDELKRFLKVDPDAANARAVQLKIYEWEGLLPK